MSHMSKGLNANALTPKALTPLPFNYILYRDGSKYYAKKFDGTEVVPGGSTKAEDVFKAVLDPTPSPPIGPGHIYIRGGDYEFSAPFSGLDLQPYTRLTLDPTTRLIVPKNHQGHVFRLRTTNSIQIRDCIVDGGVITERGDENSSNPADWPGKKWVGILLQSSAQGLSGGITHGILFNKFMNMTIYHANIAIQLLVDGNSSWINGNSFQFLKMWRCNVFIDFNMTFPWPGGQVIGIYRNHFTNIECQSGKTTTHGIRNIRHRANTFFDVKIWDIGNGGTQAVSSNIHPDDSETIIIGGIMTNQNFSYDPNRKTKILDEWQGLKF